MDLYSGIVISVERTIAILGFNINGAGFKAAAEAAFLP